MSPHPLRALPLAALALLGLVADPPGSAASAAGRTVPIQHLQEAAWSDLSALPDAGAWLELIQNDGRVSFTRRTESLAVGMLGRERTHAGQRPAALLALGCAGAVRERPRLESWAAEGDKLERCAAILALGEMRTGVEESLTRLAADSDPTIVGCALLALLRTGRPRPLAIVEQIAADASDPRAALAENLIVFTKFPAISDPSESGALLLRLRFGAASQFGLVDGMPWSMVLLGELVSDSRFLDEVVLRGAAEVNRPGVRDHVLGALLEGRGTARVRAAVQAMPLELSQLVAAELWRPSGVTEWSAILDEIEEGRLEIFAAELLRHALEVPELHRRAAGLLARAGDREALRALGPPAPDASLRERIAACEIWGSASDPTAVTALRTLSADPAPRVRAAALVARARLAEREALATVREVAIDPDHPDRPAVLEMLIRRGGRGATVPLLEALLPTLEGIPRARVASLLCLANRLSARPELRTFWAENPDPGLVDVAMVRALALYALEEERGILRELFPQGGGSPLDIELALGLLENRDPAILPVLRAALWSEPWDRSCLAGCLLVEVGGVRELLDEVRHPPRNATSRDLRRVGFAIGEWGGVVGLQDLARDLRADSGNPALQGALLGVLSARTQ